MMEDGEQDEDDGATPRDGEMSEAEIDRNLVGTFPASDPPSWTLGIDHRDDASPTPDEDEE